MMESINDRAHTSYSPNEGNDMTPGVQGPESDRSIALLAAGHGDVERTKLEELLARCGDRYAITSTSCADALARIAESAYDAYLIDTAGCADDAAALLSSLAGLGLGKPIIALIDAEGELELLDDEAISYLPIDGVSARLLARTIDHAVRRNRELATLRRNDEMLRHVASHAPLILFATDADGYITFMDGRALRTRGVKPGVGVGESLLGGFIDNERISRNIRRALSGETFSDLVYVGSYAYECHYRPTRGADGEVTGLVGLAADVTEWKQREEELRRSDRRFRALWDSALDAIMLLDAEGIITDANPALLAMSGRSIDEVIGKPVTMLFPEEHHEEVIGGYQDLFTGRDTRRFYEFTYRSNDAEERFAEGHFIFIEDQEEKTSILAMMRDVTGRKKIERALMESEEHFRLLIENALDIITVLEHDGTISYESPSIERTLGFKPEELVGQNAFSYIHPDDLERVLEVFLEGTRIPGMSAGAEFRFMNSKGEYIYLESIGTNLIEHPVIQGVVLNSRDVTERKLAEEALREAHDKLEMRVEERTAEIVKMMGALEQAHHTQRRFVADASHDLRTPLTVIAIEIDLLLQTPGYDDVTYESLARIKGEIAQLNDLASDLLLLTMLDDPQPQDTRRDGHLDAILLDEINQLTAMVTEKGVRWDVAIDQGVEYRCDLHAMRRALANVLENAVKYSSEGGRITVALKRENDCAIVSVDDEGMGIDPEDHEKVFERFYRSDKARSTPGTGLGLSIVKAVVEAHGGRVRLESEPGNGTTVIISLPL